MAPLRTGITERRLSDRDHAELIRYSLPQDPERFHGALKMTADVTSQCVQIKAVLAGLQQFKITSTARIVALLAACGVTKVSEVSALSGVCERMVRKAMKELDAAKRNQGSENGTRVPEPGFRKRNQSSENVEPEFRHRVRTPARKESPSGIYITSPSQTDSSARVREIEGLNGSTQRLCDQLAGWLAGDFGIPNSEEARSILVGSVDAYGADQVRIGMLELETRIAAGQKPRDLGRSFSGFIKNAKPAAPTRAQAAPKKSMMQLIREAKAGAAA